MEAMYLCEALVTTELHVLPQQANDFYLSE
jgi:hypothetical protein